MSPDEIAARVDELAREHEGPDFVAAVEELSDSLDQEGRDALGAVLLERANVLEAAVDERMSAKGWLRRTFDIEARAQRRTGGTR